MARPTKFKLTTTFRDGSCRKIAARQSPTDRRADRPVIFVHGTPGWAWTWDFYLRNPPQGCYGIAIDRPGFGGSAGCGVRTDFDDQCSVIEAVLDELGPQAKPILVGHSLGGPITAWAAAKHPDRFAGLLLIAPALDPQLEFPRWYKRLARRIGWLLPGPVRRSNDEIYRAAKQTRKLQSMLADIIAPTIVVHGKRDRLVPYRNLSYAKQHLCSAKHLSAITLDRAGHLIPWTHRALITDTIADLASKAQSDR